MNYLKFTKDDMLNGRGVRLTLWVAGCNHECPKCQNPETWDPSAGKLFTTLEGDDILRELSKDYISGLTLTGGDPLFPANRITLTHICKVCKEKGIKTVLLLGKDGGKLKRMAETASGFEPLKNHLDEWISNKIKEVTDKM